MPEPETTWTAYPPPTKFDAKNYRLRYSQAVKVRNYLQKEQIFPIDVINCKTLPCKIHRSEVDLVTGAFKFVFEDFSQLIWVDEFAQWGVYFPSWVRIVYVPLKVPVYKDDFNKGTNEIEFQRECKESLTNPAYGTWMQNQVDYNKHIGLTNNQYRDALDEATALALEEGLGCG